jgi:formamidopyrimidine-DNA glycosylase
MFELPEIYNLARQINEELVGKAIRRGRLGNTAHKFVWYNLSHADFERLVEGKTVGEAWAKGKWLFVSLEPDFVLVLGEWGGKVLHHAPGSQVPGKFHLYLLFQDDSFLTATTQMWGAVELRKRGDEESGEYVRNMRATPTDPDFTFDYFRALVDKLAGGKKRSAKGLLTQDQILPGLGNAIAQDILFRAGLHPKRPISDLGPKEIRLLYDTIVGTVEEVKEKGGRYDEYDLSNNRGGYVRIMDRAALRRPCPGCGGEVLKIQYLGGACYLCPTCQT